MYSEASSKTATEACGTASPVAIAFGAYRNRQDDLRIALDELSARLQLLLSPPAPEKASDGAGRAVAPSPVAEELMQAAEREAAMAAMVNDLIRRLTI
jgi:hypothetical protein